MADTQAPKPENAASPASTAGAKEQLKGNSKTAKPLGKPNPMWKYMGLGENFRPRLPSRNWSIFLAITGSFTAAVIYDKRERKRVQRKWCKLVEHVAKEPLDPRAMPRKLTVFLEAPPTDGLRIAQDHFKEYVKPILVASGLDWEFIQGRKEGDIRAELAERIRTSRLPLEQRLEEDPVAEVRRKSGIQDFDGPRGDIVIGRHTWKEYVRGLHEGWLGPLTEPPKPVVPPSDKEADAEPPFETLPGITIYSSKEAADKAMSVPSSDDSGLDANTSTESSPESKTSSSDPDKASKIPTQKPPFITTLAYPTASIPAEIPLEFDPSTPISFPHILGFLNTPRRLYRFLNRRVLADQIGRETAAVILSTYRPYNISGDSLSQSFSADDVETSRLNADMTPKPTPQTSEPEFALIEEEKEWPKSTRVRTEDEPERTWLEPVVLDPRIASRMRRFELSPADEVKAKSFSIPEEEVEGWIKGSLRSLARSGMQYFGYAKPTKVKTEADEGNLE